jgi:hypothetical protein
LIVPKVIIVRTIIQLGLGIVKNKPETS